MDTRFRNDGLTLYREGRYSDALDVFLAEEDNKIRDPELNYFIGLCHVRLHETKEAIRRFRQVLQSDVHLGRLYQTRMLLGWLLVEVGDIEKAEQTLQEVLRDGYRSPQAWAALGYCQWFRGRTYLAIESYQQAMTLDEKNSNAANGLGYLLADTGEDPEKAVKLCQLAVASDPKNMAYRDSLGWAFFRAGRTSEAVLHLTEALSGRPDDDLIKEHLEAVRTHETIND